MCGAAERPFVDAVDGNRDQVVIVGEVWTPSGEESVAQLGCAAD